MRFILSRIVLLALSSISLFGIWCNGYAQSQLISGGSQPGAITVPGQTNVWTFEAAKGDSIVVKLGEVFEGETDPEFYPSIWLLGPDGVQVGTASGYLVCEISVTAPLTGAYTLLVKDGIPTFGGDKTGSYLLHLAKTPGTFVVPSGDQGGALTNGVNQTGKIHLGDLDLWSFEAAKGDSIILKLGEVFEGETDPQFYPSIRLLGPDGAQVGAASGYLACEISVTAALSGAYTLLVNDGIPTFGGDKTGSYMLHLAKTPGTFVVPASDEGGALTNGFNHTGKIHLGDLDLWSVEAKKGDSITVKLGEVLEGETDPEFYPSIRLFGPNGAQVGEASGYLACEISITAALSGAYTLLVNDGIPTFGGDKTGSYRLHMAVAPEKFLVPAADEGGILSHNSVSRGSLHAGDLDIWNVGAFVGDNITITIKDSSSNKELTPLIRLYDPNGALISSQSGADEAQITWSAAESCLYVLVVSDSGDKTGSYELITTGLSESRQLRSQAMGSNSIKVCWPSELAGYVLQQNTVLQAEGWVDVGIVSEDSGLNMIATIPVESGNRFFRLRPANP